MDSEQLRYTRRSAQVIDKKDKTQIVCSIKATSESLKNCFSKGQWNFGTFCHLNYDKSQAYLPLNQSFLGCYGTRI